MMFSVVCSSSSADEPFNCSFVSFCGYRFLSSSSLFTRTLTNIQNAFETNNPTVTGQLSPIALYRDGDLEGTGGRSPQKKLRWGTAHAFVPQIFREAMLSGARES